MNKTEIIQWLVGHMITGSTLDPDFVMVDLWTSLSCVIEYLEKETAASKRERTMYEIRSAIKGIVSMETP